MYQNFFCCHTIRQSNCRILKKIYFCTSLQSFIKVDKLSKFTKIVKINCLKGISNLWSQNHCVTMSTKLDFLDTKYLILELLFKNKSISTNSIFFLFGTTVHKTLSPQWKGINTIVAWRIRAPKLYEFYSLRFCINFFLLLLILHDNFLNFIAQINAQRKNIIHFFLEFLKKLKLLVKASKPYENVEVVLFSKNHYLYLFLKTFEVASILLKPLGSWQFNPNRH